MMKKIITLALSFLAIGLISINSISAADNAANKKSSLAGAGVVPPVFVEVVKAAYSDAAQTLSATGSMVAVEGIQVKPEISGRVTQIYFNSGAMVKAGDPLVQLNPDVLKADFAEKRAALVLSTQSFERMQTVYKEHLASKDDLDKAEADLDSKKAELDHSQSLLNQATIVAPFSGKLGLKQISLGDYVNAGQVIVNLQMLDPIDVEFNIPETDYGKIAIGQDIALHTSSYPDLTFNGKIYAIDSLVNAATRMITVRARIANQDQKLLPGSFAEVSVVLQKGAREIKIPQTAINYESGSVFVYKVIANKAIKTVVTLGDRDKDSVIVKGGISEGDVIITAGQVKLHEGATVIVRNS